MTTDTLSKINQGQPSDTDRTFDYELAFSRNIGLVSPEEQSVLSGATVAIAGLGGVGGVHATTLARLGIGSFHLADLDHFEIHNVNRQTGARTSTLGRPKTHVMREMIQEINPHARIRTFDDGIDEANIQRFLHGVDIAVDGLDFFAVAARDLFYRATRDAAVPVVAAGPIGCSAALLVFMPHAMSWHEYFAMDLAENEVDRYVLFALGTAPKATHLPYMDRRYVSLAEKRGPSLSLAVELCAGVTAAEILKILLRRGTVYPAPYYHQFDAYRCRYVRGKLRWGNRGPIQRLKLQLFRRLYGSPSRGNASNGGEAQ